MRFVSKASAWALGRKGGPGAALFSWAWEDGESDRASYPVGRAARP